MLILSFVRTCVLLALFSSLIFLAPAQAADFYVSPTGSNTGLGTIQSPWSLAYALNHPPAVRPGDTIWLRGGIYNAAQTGYAAYHSKLTGAPGQPIIVRQYQGERAIIDARDSGTKVPGLRIDGGWAWFWGFEVMNSHPTRSLNEARNAGVEVYGSNVKLINLTVYDTGQGIGFWSVSLDSELYGNLIYNNGWLAFDRGHGHGIYTQNSNGIKTIRNNLVLQQYGYGLHAYGTNAALNNYVVERNTLFGSTALIGGQMPATNITFNDNRSYGISVMLGRDVDSQGLTANSNYIAGGFRLSQWSNAQVKNNFVHPVNQKATGMMTEVVLRPTGVPADYQIDQNSYIQGNARSGFDFVFRNSANVASTLSLPLWQSASGYDLNSSQSPTLPATAKTFLEPNQYDPGRATLTVYNWPKQNSVTVDISALSPQTGDVIEVRNALNWPAESMLVTYTGGPISIPMSGWTVAAPIGDMQSLATSPYPDFGLFVLTKQASGVGVNITPQVATVQAGQQQQLSLSVVGTTNHGVTWSVTPALGTVSPAGLYTAPSSLSVETTVTVTAISTADPTRSSSALIRLVPNVSVSITPASPTVGPGGAVSLLAQVAGTATQDVIWRVQPSALGTLSTTGRYMAPSTVTKQQVVTVTAASAVDPTKVATATITLVPGVGVNVSPGSATIKPGATAQFKATLYGTTNQAVTWSVSPGVGSISSAGLYTAPSSLSAKTTVLITATSVASSSASGTAVVTIEASAGVGVSVTPAAVTVQAGKTAQLAAQVSGTTNTAVGWSLSPAVGSISSSGLYTAPSSVASQTVVTAKAVSAADPTRFATSTITVTPAGVVSVSVTPGTATVQSGKTIQFSAAVSGTTNTAVSWTLSPSVGSISSSGLYTAPASVSSATTVTVKATSAADPTKSASATLTVQPAAGISVSVTPAIATVQPGKKVQFTAQVTGSTNPAVSWSLSPAVGSISSAGVYTAPATLVSATTVVVKATSAADATRFGTATLTVSPSSTSTSGLSVAVAPASITLTAAQTYRFFATVAGTSNTAVTWRIKSGSGSISSLGLYTAPASVSSTATTVIEAASVADRTRVATATITLVPGISVLATPSFFDVYPYERQQLTVTVLNTSNKGVTYSLSKPLGSISSSGLYTPPASVSQQTWLEIIVTSVADPTRKARVQVLLWP